MANSSDGLTEHLLFQIAITGEEGLSASAFRREVIAFHDANKIDNDADGDNESDSQHNSYGGDIFFSKKPPISTFVVNSTYIESIWESITTHQDISLSQKADENQNADIDADIPANQSNFTTKHKNDILLASEAQIWRVVAGHGVDHKKVSKLEFQCLTIIASHGPAGVLQPLVVAKSGQDKRSLPKRTDSLAAKGYITKEPCIGGGQKTSLLKLKRFSVGLQAKASASAIIPAGEGAQADEKVIRYDIWYDQMINMLQSRAGSVPFLELKELSGVGTYRKSLRALNRCMLRFAKIGVIESYYTRGGPDDARDVTEGGSRKSKPNRVRYIKMLRQPTPHDRATFIADPRREAISQDKSGRKFSAKNEDSDEDEADNSDDEQLVLDNVASHVPEDTATVAGSNLMCTWSPDANIANLLFDAVNSTGVIGGTTFDLCAHVAGNFWRRPFDESIGRLSDLWQVSQPPELRHLSIVRDTKIQGVTTRYTFRSMANFAKVVATGEASWAYLTEDLHVAKAVKAEPNLDAWGFPVVDKSKLCDQRRYYSVCDCSRTTNSNSKSKKAMTSKPSNKRMHKSETEEDGDDNDQVRFSKKHKTSIFKGRRHAGDTANANRGDTEASGQSAGLIASDVPITRNMKPKTGKPDLKQQEKWGKRYSELASAWDMQIQRLARDIVNREGNEGVSKKRKHAESSSSMDHLIVDGNQTDGVQLKELVEQLKVMFRPGVYVNEPRAVMIHRDTGTEQGRPRNGFLLTFKLKKLEDQTWFEFDESARPSQRLISLLPHVFDTHRPPNEHVAPNLPQDEGTSQPQDVHDASVQPTIGTPAAEDSSTPNQVTSNNGQSEESITTVPTPSDLDRSGTLEADLEPLSKRRKLQHDSQDGSIYEATTNTLADPQTILSSPIGVHSPHNTDDLLSHKQLSKPQSSSKPAPSMASHDNRSDRNSIISHPKTPTRTIQTKSGQKKRARIRRTGGQVEFQRTKVVIDIIEDAGGVFPGKYELSLPFASVWQTRYGVYPDRKTLGTVLRALVDAGKLQKIAFTFTDSRGLHNVRHMYASPRIELSGPEILKVKQEVASRFPLIYLPPGVPLTSDIRKSLDERENSYKERVLANKDKEVKRVQIKQARQFSIVEAARKRMLEAKYDAVDPGRTRAVVLGTTERMIRESAERRRYNREMEEATERARERRRKQTLEQRVGEMSSEFQINSYNFVPQAAQVDRGPSGRGRIAKRIDLGGPAEDINHTTETNTSTLQKSRKSTKEIRWDKECVIHVQRFLMNPVQVFHAVTNTILTPSLSLSSVPAGNVDTVKGVVDLSKHDQSTISNYPVPRPYSGTAHVQARIMAPLSSISSGTNRTVPVKTADQVHRVRRVKQLARPKPSFGSGYLINDPENDVPMSRSEENRLPFAIAVVKTLAGGLQQDNPATNYSLVNQAMHFKFDAKYCREHWTVMKATYSILVTQLQEQFRDLFLEAYANDELPVIDMNYPENTDWAGLVDWLQEKTGVQESQDQDSVKSIRLNALSVAARPENVHQVDIEDYFVAFTSNIRKTEMLDTISYFEPLERTQLNAKIKDDDLVAESWIRSNVNTPIEAYNRDKAYRKLNSLGKDRVERSKQALLGKKLIKAETRKNTPGREFIAVDNISSLLSLPWQWTITMFKSAVKFKQDLDVHFKTDLPLDHESQRPVFTLPADLSNSIAAVLLNLCDKDRVEIRVDLPEINHDFDAPYPKLTKWGYTEGNYKTVQMDKNKLTFGLSILPTEKYLFNSLTIFDSVDTIPKVPKSKIFKQDEGNEASIPIWADIHDGLMMKVLEPLVLTVLYILSSRPNISTNKIVKILKNKVWRWEMYLLCEWMRDARLLVCRKDDYGIDDDDDNNGDDDDDDEKGLWSLDEWWWMAHVVLKAQ